MIVVVIVDDFVVVKNGVGDANDLWKVELVNGREGDPVRTVSSRLKLRHVNLGCYLHSHSKQLPKWYVLILYSY